MTHPTLSIITPCFNPGPALRHCIESVSQQATTEVEHIVQDARSTDGSLEYLLKAQSENPHLVVHSEKDRGQSDAMNRAIARCRGEFIGILNADDYYCADVLPKVLAHLANKSRPVFLFGDLLMVKPEVNKTAVQSFPNFHAFDPYLLRYPSNPACYFYSKKLHDLAGAYDEEDHLTMDLDFLIRSLPFAEIIYLHGPLGAFVLHAKSKTQIDLNAGTSNARKRAVVRRHLRSASILLRLRILGFRLKRHLGYLKWKLMNPSQAKAAS